MSENPYEIASFKLEHGDEVSISYDIDAPSPLEDERCRPTRKRGVGRGRLLDNEVLT